MFGSDVLDIAITMVFVYFLLSLLVMTVAELISRVFALRSSNLVNAISDLLADPEINDSKLVDDFWKHPLMARLTRQGTGHGIGQGNDKPSYIPANLFVLALLDAIKGQVHPAKDFANAEDVRSALNELRNTGSVTAGPKYDQLVTLLLAIIGVDTSTLKQAQVDVAKWFDDYMDQASGWYRRKMQMITLALAIAVVAVLNADSLAILDAVSSNAELRQAAVAAATAYVQEHPSPVLSPTEPISGTQTTVDLVKPVKAIIELQDTLADLNLPVWWTPAEDRVPKDWAGWLYKVLGLLITALLVSIGAPFWFDLLNRLVNLRATGNPPDKMPDLPGENEKAPPKGNATGPVVADRPALPDTKLDRLADDAVTYVKSLKARGKLTDDTAEDDAGIHYLRKECNRQGLFPTEGQLAGAWEAAYRH